MTALNYGAWAKDGVVFRSPGSGSIGPSEALPAIKAKNYGYVLFDPTTGDWKDERIICDHIGLPYGAWTRTRTAHDVDVLVNACRTWNVTRIAPNVEIEDTRDGTLMMRILGALSKIGVGMVITDGWADPIGHWQGFRKWVGSVECFPAVNPAFADVAGCLMHGNSFFRATTAMLQAYAPDDVSPKPVRANYKVPASVPIVVFCGDDVEDWSKW